MNTNKVTKIPDDYIKAVNKELQGTISEISYTVRNYINEARKLVSDKDIQSSEAGREVITGEAIEKKCNIYLPAGYDKDDSNTKYNVLYLLHGVGGNRYEWLFASGNVDGNHIICNIIDNLIAKGDIEPLIVVFPEGRSTSEWQDTSFNSEGINMLGFYYFDYELRYDLIPFIESQYNTYANIKDKSDDGIAYNRTHRAIAGLSMGAMQSVNLILGGYRCDSTLYTNSMSSWKNGLDNTVITPGMVDLFAYVGAFSNAPTSSDGYLLGTSISQCGHILKLLYITCGDADGVSYEAGYSKVMNGLLEAAGDNIEELYKVIMKDRVHDFNVWNNGAYNFLGLLFQPIQARKQEHEYIIY